MADPKASAKRLAEAVGDAQGVSTRSKRLLDDLKTRSAKLEAAIKAGHVDSIDLLTGEIEASVKREDQELRNIAYILRDPIGEVRRDETFALAKAAQIEKLVDFLSGIQTELTNRFEEAEKLLERAAAALKQLSTGKGAALRELAALDLRIKERSGELRSLNDMAADMQRAAVVAFAARDAAALTRAKREIEDYQIGKEEKAADVLQAEVDAFVKRWKAKSLGADVESQFDTVAAKFKKSIDDMRPWVRQSLAALKECRGYNLPKPDAKKALKALDLPADAEAKVTKAIGLPLVPMEKAFDGIVKELKLKTTGKKMVEVLVKAGVV